MSGAIPAIALKGKASAEADLLDAMIVIRGIESALRDASIAGQLEGPVHVSLGEEAVAVGIAAAMRADDVLLSNHRGHGHALACGLDPTRVLAEIVGHPSGFSRGRGGSMHLFDPANGFYGTNGIVGGNAAVALGAAFALQMEKAGRVAVVVFGDGAMATGTVAEALNLAALWSLPIVFVCENNGYAEMTPTSSHLASAPADRARGYGLYAEQIDGTSLTTVIQAGKRAIAEAAQGKPVLIEAKCFRFGGHYAADPALYRPAGEDEEWRERHDPIRRFGAHLGMTSDEIAARIDRVRERSAIDIERLAV